jgi:hippurate hydrolase
MHKINKAILFASALVVTTVSVASDLSDAIQKDYSNYLVRLWERFHQNPELSLMETKTAKRLATELSAAGTEVTENVGGTGIVAIIKNGEGTTLMVQADMDGLPVREQSGLPDTSQVTMQDWDGDLVSVMHACGHDV